MKKFLTLIVAAMLAITMVGCGTTNTDTADTKFTAGTYTAEATGFHGPVKVEVEVDAESILNVTVVEHGETQGVGTNAIDALPGLFVKHQSLAVDAISGATITSEALVKAVETALVEAGATAEELYTEVVEDAVTVEDAEADIVIIGAGGAGLAAAIEATNAGKSVILIEKAGVVGGTTTLATTAYNAGGSSVQMAMETPFTADDYYAKLVGTAEDPIARMQADRSGADADWLLDMGADMTKVINGSQHTTTDGSAFGPMLVKTLNDKVTELGVDVRLNAKGTKLITEGEKVTGVEVETEAGNYKVTAKAVILATGGFASNPEFVDKYTPQWSGYPSTAAVGATGDGIAMALEVGAGIGNMDKASPQTVAYDTGTNTISFTFLRYNGAILVNKEGTRFVDELGNTAVLGAAIKEATDGGAYIIIDQSTVDASTQVQGFVDAGYFIKAETVEELAGVVGCEATVLEATLAKMKTAVETGKDEEFGRKDGLVLTFENAPFYTAWITPANQTTLGGINIDTEAHVLREDGSIIEGLYAGGETTNSNGQGLTRAVTIGRLAGETAAREIAE